MALSVRDVARRCLGITGAMSINRDVYGYIFRDTDGSLFGTLQGGGVDILPGSGTPTGRSLQRHLQTISGDAIDLVPIFVDGGPGGSFTFDQATKVQYAIQVARDIYAQQNLGIRRLNWHYIQHDPQAAASTNPANNIDALNVTAGWSGPPGAIDVFFVQIIGDAEGWAAEGACPPNKDATDVFTGAVVQIGGILPDDRPRPRRITGIILSHEVGHYLGLPSGTTITNVMGHDPDGNRIDEVDNTSTGLTDEQGTKMREHCSVSLVS